MTGAKAVAKAGSRQSLPRPYSRGGCDEKSVVLRRDAFTVSGEIPARSAFGGMAGRGKRSLPRGYTKTPPLDHRRGDVSVFCGLPLLLQMLLRVAMVISVSPGWVRIEPGRDSSSSLSLQAGELAMAVMQAVNSQGFTEDHLPCHCMSGRVSECIAAQPAVIPRRTPFGKRQI